MQMHTYASTPTLQSAVPIVPAFEVTPMTRKRVRTKTTKDEAGFKMVEEVITEDGYMVKTKRGDSAFVSHADLVRLKLDKFVPMLAGDDAPIAGVMPVNLNKPRVFSDGTTQHIPREQLEMQLQELRDQLAKKQADDASNADETEGDSE